MALNRKIRVRGFDKLAKKLKRLPVDLRNKTVERADKVAWLLVKNDAIAKARMASGPINVRGTIYTPGNLKRAIIMRREGRFSPWINETAVYVAGGSRGPRGRAFYWYFLEFGTVKMSPKPFLLPAFRATAPLSLRVLREAYRKGLKSAVGKL